MDYPLMAADVNKFMASRGLETAVVIGPSMGGKTAMQFALQFPGRAIGFTPISRRSFCGTF